MSDPLTLDRAQLETLSREQLIEACLRIAEVARRGDELGRLQDRLVLRQAEQIAALSAALGLRDAPPAGAA